MDKESTMPRKHTFSVSVLIFKGQHSWVAQCLEYDIAAQGTTISEATLAFEQTFAGQVVVDIHNNRQPLEGVSQAPQHYWHVFQAAERLEPREPSYLKEGVPPAFIIAEQDRRISS